MSNNKANIDITVDDAQLEGLTRNMRQLSRNLDDATDEARKLDREMGQVERGTRGASRAARGGTAAFGAMSAAIGGITIAATAAAAAVAAIGVGLVRSTQTAFEQAEVFRELDASLGQAGIAYSDAEASLTSFFAEQQRTTRFGDDATAAAIAQAARLTAGTGASIQQLQTMVSLAQDIATAQGMSLDQATQMVASAAAGTARGLDRLIPAQRDYIREINRMEDASERGAALMDLLTESFEGQRLELTENELGLARLQNGFGDVQEAIGDVVLDSLEASGILNTLADAIDSIAKSLESGEGFAGTFGSTIRSLMDSAVETFNELRDVLERNEAGFQELAYAIAGVGESLPGVIRLFDDWWRATQPFRDASSYTTPIGIAFRLLSDRGEDAINQMRILNGEIDNVAAVTNIFGVEVNELRSALGMPIESSWVFDMVNDFMDMPRILDRIIERINALFGTSFSFGDDDDDPISRPYRRAVEEVERLTKAQERAKAESRALAEEAQAAATAIFELASSNNEAVQSGIDIALNGISALGEAIQEQADTIAEGQKKMKEALSADSTKDKCKENELSDLAEILKLEEAAQGAQDAVAGIGVAAGEALATGQNFAKASKAIIGDTIGALGRTYAAAGAAALIGDPTTGWFPNPARGAGLLAAGTAMSALASALGGKGGKGGGKRGSKTPYGGQQTSAPQVTINQTTSFGFVGDRRAATRELEEINRNSFERGLAEA